MRPATRRFLASIVKGLTWIGDAYGWCFGVDEYARKDILAEMQLAYLEILQDLLARAERRAAKLQKRIDELEKARTRTITFPKRWVTEIIDDINKEGG